MFFLGDIIRPKKKFIQFKAYALYGKCMMIYEHDGLFAYTDVYVDRMFNINNFELVN